MFSNRFKVKTEFEIASEYYPPNFKSGAFFDDEIEAVNEGRVEPIEDAWYQPFSPKEYDKCPEIAKNEILEEPTKIYDFSKYENMEENFNFDHPNDEEYDRNVIHIDLVSNSEISDVSPESTDSDYKPENDQIRTFKKSPKPFTSKQNSKKIKKSHTRLNLEEVIQDLGDNVRPYLDSCTSRKGDIVCPDCPRRFGTYKSLHTHLEVHLKGNYSRCPICQCVYPSKTHLIRHLQHHTSERTFICEVCGKGFFYLHCLTQHQQVHQKEKPFVCKFCSAKFGRHSNLKNHIRTHTGEKPYSCEFCSKTFQRSLMLKNHQKENCGEMLYKCDICENCFPTNGLLERHMYNHCEENTTFAAEKYENIPKKETKKSNERPYECKVCGARFRKSSLRTKHINRHLASNAISVSYSECV